MFFHCSLQRLIISFTAQNIEGLQKKIVEIFYVHETLKKKLKLKRSGNFAQGRPVGVRVSLGRNIATDDYKNLSVTFNVL
jgi:hypothetical protein